MADEQNDMGISGGSDYPEELKARARGFFAKAAEVAYALQYDYAIELYLEGLSFWPEAVEQGHNKLWEIALHRKVSGGKKSGFTDKSKHKKGGSKGSKEALLKAEYLLCKDPTNQSHMEDMVTAASEAGCGATALWMADILFDTNLRNPKPKLATYVLLRDVYSQFENYARAVQACQMALQIKPDDMNMEESLRDLSARQTLQKGRYEDADDFRDSIKDRQAQAKLQAQEQVVRSDEFLAGAITEARQNYEQEPNDANLDKLVSALCDTEKSENEDKAIELLEKTYAQTNQFSHRQRSGDIRIKQKRRKLRHLQEQLKKDPKNDDIIGQVSLAQEDSLKIELAHYRSCVDNYPTDRRMKYEYGQRLLRAKKYDEAIPLFQESRNDPRHRMPSLNSIGQCFFCKKWYPDAAEFFQQAFDLVENKESKIARELLYKLGRAYQADSNLNEALECFRKVIQIDFNYRDARDRVAQLRKQIKNQ